MVIFSYVEFSDSPRWRMDGPTYQLTGLGARDVSKKRHVFYRYDQIIIHLRYSFQKN